MFKKIVAVEPVNIPADMRGEFNRLAGEVVWNDTLPGSGQEIIERMQGADAMLVSFTTKISGEVLAACPDLKYIGMCCSLYGPESCNVDLIRAKELGITVTGVFDYGDAGVPEFVISEVVRLLHGFGGAMWKAEPQELTGQKVGILGMGTTGQCIARAMRFFGAQVCYFSRTRKPQIEAELGLTYMPLDELLPWADILCSCLNTNTALMHEEQFALFGSGKIYVNTSISVAHDMRALESWLKSSSNFAIGDFKTAIDPSGGLQRLPNVICAMQSSGVTYQAKLRLGQKVMENIESFLAGRA